MSLSVLELQENNHPFHFLLHIGLEFVFNLCPVMDGPYMGTSVYNNSQPDSGQNLVILVLSRQDVPHAATTITQGDYVGGKEKNSISL